MEDKLLNDQKQFMNRKRKKTWRSIVSFFACVVVFCTTYALILPAITLEGQTFCGHEEHSHGEECYRTDLICTVSEEESEEEQTEMIVEETATEASNVELHTHTEECYETNVNLICELEESEEHLHEDACYETVETLICELEEVTEADLEEADPVEVETEEPVHEKKDAHIHTEECYAKTLVCDKEVHVHEKICYSDKTADVETAEDWEKDLPKELTTNWAEDLIAVAESQLGYEESTKNFIVTEEGDVKGYTRYGDWYGDTYGDWCAMFVSFCLDYAKVDTEYMPQNASCQKYIELLTDEEERYQCYYEADTYEPVPGDLIFFNWDEEPDSDHVGIVVELKEEKKQDETFLTIKTIEGNSSDTVKYNTYELSDESIMGYAALPKNPEEKQPAEQETEEQKTEEQKKEEPDVVLKSPNRLTGTIKNTKDANGVVLTGNWATDIIAIANSYAGYQETNGISMFDQWAGGDGSGNWNVNFVNYCLDQAGISSSIIPWDVSYDFATWTNALRSKGIYKDYTNGAAKPGDILFVQGWNAGQEYNVGIIVEHPNAYTVAFGDMNGNGQVILDDGFWPTWTDRILGYVSLSDVVTVSDSNMSVTAKYNLDAGLANTVLKAEFIADNEDYQNLVKNSIVPTGNSITEDYYLKVYFENSSGQRVEPEGAVVIDITFETPLDPNASNDDDSTPPTWSCGEIVGNDVYSKKLQDVTINSLNKITKVSYAYKPCDVIAFAASQGTKTQLSASSDGVTVTASGNAEVLPENAQLEFEFVDGKASWNDKLKEKYAADGIIVTDGIFFKLKIINVATGRELEVSENAKIDVKIGFDPSLPVVLPEGKELIEASWKLDTLKEDNDNNVTIGTLDSSNTPVISETGNYDVEEIKFLYESHDYFALTVLAEDSGFMIPNSADRMDEIQSIIDKAGSAKNTITLSADIKCTDTIEIPSGKYIEIDLNEHTIQASTTVFNVNGGKLLITDSQKKEESVSTVDGSVVANEASYSESSKSLTYYVTETTVTDSNIGTTRETLKKHTVSLSGMIEGSNSKDPLITISNGTFTLLNGALAGSENRAIVQSGGTLELKGGYICGNTAAGRDAAGNQTWDDRVSGGAIYTTGKSTINLSGTVLADNHVAERGGAIAVESSNGAKLNISGGVISGNSCTSDINTGKDDHARHVGGGGVFIDGSVTLNMTGGYITNNRSDATGYFDGGGGVFISGNSVYNLKGGYVTGNYAEGGGGGIRSDFWGHYTTFTIDAGFVSANHAETAEGGGISINWDGVAYIRGGHVTNNTTDTVQHWGGGGLFVSNGAKMFVVHAIVTENTAGGFGAGVAGCSTGRVFVVSNDGGAIYGNDAAGTTVTDGSEKAEDKIYGLYNEVFMKSGFDDYFCALTSTVEGTMLGGGAANWKGSVDEVPVSIGKGETITASYVMGLNANPTKESINAAIAEAKKTNGMYINNNDSHTHGGGILCNGYLVVGSFEDIEVGTSLELTAKKSLLNELEQEVPLGQIGTDGEVIEGTLKQFEYVITDAAGTVVSTGTNDVNGNITFSARLPFNKTGTFVYYIYERTDVNNEGYVMDTTQYRMTVDVTKSSTVFDEELGIKKYQYKISRVLLEKSNGQGWATVNEWNVEWISEYEYSAVKMALTSNATFKNYELNSNSTKVNVIKKWAGETPSDMSVTVVLQQNGTDYTGPNAEVVLSDDNGWMYTWEGLPTKGEDGRKYTYTVKEKEPAGYTATYEVFNDVAGNGYWVPATSSSLQLGTSYIIVSPDGKYVLNLTPDHADLHLTSADKLSATKGTSSITVGGTTYTDYYPSNTISARSIYKAISSGLNSGATGTILQNTETGSALLIEPNNGLNLKDGTAVDRGYVSAFYLSSGRLMGYEKWDMNDSTNRYIICYDENNEKFEALPDNYANRSKEAKLYVKVQGDNVLESETSVIITNTKVEDITYGLDITKVSNEVVGDQDAGNHTNIPLADAKFVLKDQAGEILHFTKDSAGKYVWYSGTLTEEAIENTVTELVTGTRGKLYITGLPAGKYILEETKAPDGYALAAPEEVTVGNNVSNKTVSLTIVDNKIVEGGFVLPETGGMGTAYYMMGGWLLVLSSVILLYRKRKSEKR